MDRLQKPEISISILTSLNTKIQNFDNNPEIRKQSKREVEDDFEQERKVWKVLK